MDKQGNRVPSDPQKVLDQFARSLKEDDTSETPRKITPEEYFSSPEFQRRQKLAKEQREREAFEKRVAFRVAQEQNPIKGRPRRKRGKKRGRKFRSR